MLPQDCPAAADPCDTKPPLSQPRFRERRGADAVGVTLSLLPWDLMGKTIPVFLLTDLLRISLYFRLLWDRKYVWKDLRGSD